MKFKLYQLKHEENIIRKYGFMDSDFAKEHGLSLDDYEITYEGEIESGRYIEGTLNNIFVKFNVNRPEDFKGHSMSVSDIVEIGGEYWYTDGIGFTKLSAYDLL